MPRAKSMRMISLDDVSYDAVIKEIERGEHEKLAGVSSLAWGEAELYRFGKFEYVILTIRVGQPHPLLLIGGRREARNAWQFLAKAAAKEAL